MPRRRWLANAVIQAEETLEELLNHLRNSEVDPSWRKRSPPEKQLHKINLTLLDEERQQLIWGQGDRVHLSGFTPETSIST